MRCAFNVYTAERNMRQRWSGLARAHSRSKLMEQNERGISIRRGCSRGYANGGYVQCLSCRADNKMLLMDVFRDQSMKEPTIEHQIYMCSVCRHTTRRVEFKRNKMPITHLPVIPIMHPHVQRRQCGYR